ncbi:MAG: hypothetical protein AAGI07_06995 [Bacteroidota bacterium]
MRIDFNTIDKYLSANKSNNFCGHTNLNIDPNEFEEIGDLYDDSFGYLSYLSLKSDSDSEEFLGSYPLQDCKILECKTCKQIVFFHYNDGGIAPRPEYFLANYNSQYLVEPAAKSVSLNVNYYQDFITEFGLEEQDKIKNLGFEPYKTIFDKTSTYLFNYREYKGKNGMDANFDIVGLREFLREINKWIENRKE